MKTLWAIFLEISHYGRGKESELGAAAAPPVGFFTALNIPVPGAALMFTERAVDVGVGAGSIYL
jgi:hypothetical protein